jgi:transketolase
VSGGLVSAVAETAAQEPGTPVYPIGVEDTFGESGKAAEVLKKYGICAEHIVEVVKSR